MSDYTQLVKPGLNGLVLVTTAVGFVVASSGPIDWLRLVITLVGTGMAASGASALNQVLERDLDARMERTASRPMAAGRMTAARGAVFGVVVSGLGVALLAWRISWAVAGLAALTIAIYVFVYTPLKRHTPINTLVGAIPGAIPPMIGWLAASGRLDLGAWILFSILFLWQIPHFLAIAWMYREDYSRAEIAMLPVVDPDGGSTGRQAAWAALALIPVSLAPSLIGLAGAVYFAGALALGVALLGFSLAMVFRLRRRVARRLLLASITYLPALLALLVLDRGR